MKLISKLIIFSLFVFNCSKAFEITARFKGDASLVVSTQSLTLTEGQAAGTFNISLASKPTDAVSIALESSDLHEARISPQSLTFTPDDFGTPQVVTVYPLSDCVIDGDKNIKVKTTQIISADTNFQSILNSMLNIEVAVTVKDNASSIPQLMIQSNHSTLHTAEDGTVDKFLVALSCPPSLPVTVNLNSSNTAEGVLDISSVTLNSSNYSMGALVTVTGQPDCIQEPDISYQVNASTVSSQAAFNALPASIPAINQNVPLTPGLLVLNSTGQLNRGTGSYNNFQVMMTCAPSVATVNMTTTISGLTAPQFSLWSPAGPPLGTHTFTPTNWNMPTDIVVQVLTDAAGAYSINLNTDQPLVYSPVSINVADSGFRKLNINVTGSTGVLSLQNGSTTLQINGAQIYSMTYPVNTGYQFAITGMPTGQICAFKEKQFGTFGTTTMTLNINCVNGQMVGGRYQAISPQALNYHLYQGKVSNFATVTSADGITSDGTNIFVNSGATVQKSSISAPGFSQMNLGIPGFCDASNAMATVGVLRPMALATDGTNLYIGDHWAHMIFKIPVGGGTLSHIAGTGAGCNTTTVTSVDNANPLLATFNGISDLSFYNGSLYISEYFGMKIRKMDLATGAVSTVYTSNSNIAGLAVVSSGGTDYLYFALHNGHKIQRITLSTGNLDSWVAGTGNFGFQDGPIASAVFWNPYGLISDGTNLFVTDNGSGRVRRINLRNGIVSTLAGDGTNAAMAYATGVAAKFFGPRSITTDGRNLYVANIGGGVVTKITDNGLVGYWPLAGNANDYNSDNATALNGTVNGGLGTTGDRFGVANLASTVNGTSQYISASDAGLPTGTSPSTICAWVRPAALPTTQWWGIVDYGTAAIGQRRGLFLFGSGQIGHNGFGVDHTANFALPINTWSHLCAAAKTLSVAQIQSTIYVNGKSIGTQTLAWNTLLGGVGALYVGSSAEITPRTYFNGAIAEVRIYARALNEGEINELAQDAAPANVGVSYNTAATGLLSHYTLDSILDSGPLNNTLAYSSGAMVVGKDGDTNGAFSFNGTPTQYLSSTSSAGLPMGNHPRTVCAWTNPALLNSAIFSEVVTYGNGYGLGMDAGAPNAGRMFILDAAGDLIYNQPHGLNVWHHLCATFDGTTEVLYVDASPVVSANRTLSTTTGSIAIGRHNVAGNDYFNGKIDDVRIYNNALTAAQVRQLATQVPTGLVARYDFTGDATDVSGWGNNGTLLGTPTQNSDRFGNAASAYTFNGSNSISVPASSFPTLKVARTICSWGKLTTKNGFAQYMMGYGSGVSAGLGQGLATTAAGGTNYVGYGDDVAFGQYYLNTWNQYCGTFDGITANFYINGALVGSINKSATWNTSASATMEIGNFPGTSQHWIGDIDDVRVYNRALAANEIRSLSGYHPMQVSTWNPVAVTSSMKLHLQAEAAICGVAVCSNGGNVSSWTDSSGQGNTVTQATAVNRPTFRSSGTGAKPMLDFNGTSSYLALLTPPAGFGGAAYSFFTIVNRTSTTSADEKILSTGSYYTTTVGGLSVYLNTSSLVSPFPPYALKTDQTGCVTTLTSTPFIASNTAYLISSDDGGGIFNHNIYRNGTFDISATSMNKNYLADNLYIGAESANFPALGGYFGGTISEIIYFNAQIGNNVSAYGAPYTDREIVECYLSSKYGIALGHTCP